MSGATFRRDVQGLRGVAVLLVVLFHVGLPVRGGFVGVDVFFVISGFVIGASLLAELRQDGRVSYLRFYARRIRRLLPALAVLLVFVSTIGVFLSPVGANQILARTGVAASVFLSNVHLARASDGYFDPSSEWNPLLHTWSLSVEEQFYFVFPVVIGVAFMLGLRRGRAERWVVVALVAIAVVSFVLSEVWLRGRLAVGAPPGRLAFFMMPSRAWEFIAGLLIAVWALSGRYRPVSAVIGPIAGATGAVLVVGSALLLDDASRFPGVLALPVVVGTVLLVLAGVAGVTQRVLSTPWLVRLGDASYSWYLWHWPFIVFGRALLPGVSTVWVSVAAAALSLIPAQWSYRYVEQPVRASTTLRGRRSLVIAAVCVALPLGASGTIVLAEDRLPTGDAAYVLEVDHLDRSVCDSRPPSGDRGSQMCRFGDLDAERSVVMLGDSNARHFFDGLTGAARETGWSVEFGVLNACPFIETPIRRPASGIARQCSEFTRTVIENLNRRPPDLILVSLTEGYFNERALELQRPDGSWADGSADRDAVFVEAFASALEHLRASGAQVAVMLPVPKPAGFDPQECARVLWLLASSNCGRSAQRDEMLAKSGGAWEDLRESAQRAAVDVVDLSSWFCSGDRCDWVRDGIVLYRDYGHISVAASAALTDEFEEILRGYER